MIIHTIMKRRLQRLLRDDRGSILPMMAALMVALVGMSALAVETLSWYVAKREMQRAADAAAVQGVYAYRDSTAATENDKRTGALKRANAFAVKNGATGTGVEASMSCTTASQTVDGLTILASCTDGGYLTAQFYEGTVSGSTVSRVRVVATQSHTNIVGSLFAGSTTVKAAGAAGLTAGGTTPCVLGLNSSGSSVKVSGNETLNVTNCSVQSNGDLVVAGTSSVSANAVYADDSLDTNGGKATISASEKLSGSDVVEVSDPYADNGYTTMGCSKFDGDFSNKNNETNTPTTCQDSWSITGGTVTLASSTSGTTYYINGNLKVTGGTLTGSNVTIVVKGNISITGGTVTLSAPDVSTTTNKYDGVVLVSAGTGNNKITGNTGLSFSGLIYSPNADLEFHGNSESSTQGNCLLLVGNTVHISGGGGVTSNGCTIDEQPTAGKLSAVSLVN